MSVATADDFSVGSLETVLDIKERPAPPGPVQASLTFGWRALLKIKHVPEQLFDVTLFPVMFTLMFTYLFGGALEGSTKEYLIYLMPGAIVQSIIFITMYTGMTLNNDIEKGVFDRFRSLPVWRPSTLVGALMADIARFTMASTVVSVLGLALGWRPEGGLLGVVSAIALLLVFCFGLGWIWTLLGLVMRTQQSVLNLSMSIMFPLTFASNVFVDPDTMPGWVQAFVKVNPVTQLVDASRGFIDGNPDMGAVAWVLGASVVLTVIFAPLAMRKYARK